MLHRSSTVSERPTPEGRDRNHHLYLLKLDLPNCLPRSLNQPRPQPVAQFPLVINADNRLLRRRRWSVCLLAWILLGTTGLQSLVEAVAADEAPRPRLRVKVPEEGLDEIKDRLQTAVQAANGEDLDSFIECFTPAVRVKMRRRMGLVFVQHDMMLDLIDDHVIHKTDSRAEVGVKYSLHLTGYRHELVAVLRLVRDSDAWLISSEKIEKSSSRPTGYAGSMAEGGNENLPQQLPGCRNGRCGVAAPFGGAAAGQFGINILDPWNGGGQAGVRALRLP